MKTRRSPSTCGALLAYVALAAACATVSPPPRPPESASRPTPSTAPAPSIPDDTRSIPDRDGSAGFPPSSTRPNGRSEPEPSRDVPTARPQSDASGASEALVEQSRAQRAAGSLPAARASLERALRLDPNNAVVWLELGELELQTGNTAQAATLARKALTLVGRNAQLSARAERLLRAAE
jgi:tetratricopeptide (TPR) repeat protein